MVRVHTTPHLSVDEHREVLSFLDHVHALDCTRLDDHLHLDLARGPRPGFLAATARSDDGRLVGYAQASSANDGVLIDVVVPSNVEDDGLRADLLATVIDAVPHDRAVRWWTHPGHGDEALARRLGMTEDRRLDLMERPLPIDHLEPSITTRPFRPGTDDEEWLAVNNAAFADHGEQGGWDRELLTLRFTEPWFDPDGFLLHERDGHILGFCWTKIHQRDDGPVGEIYVIGVHPKAHGGGLGRSLTLAGLRHMESVGAQRAILYVDAANAAAAHLYRDLGFHVAHHHLSYRRPPRSER